MPQREPDLSNRVNHWRIIFDCDKESTLEWVSGGFIMNDPLSI